MNSRINTQIKKGRLKLIPRNLLTPKLLQKIEKIETVVYEGAIYMR